MSTLRGLNGRMAQICEEGEENGWCLLHAGGGRCGEVEVVYTNDGGKEV